MKEVNKWQKRFKYRKASKYVIIICFFLSVIIIGLTVYGSNVGNFVITVDENVTISMSLSNSRDFKNPASMLSAAGLEEMKDTTLRAIPVEDIAAIDGAANDTQSGRYMAYTFYARNTSQIAIGYRAEIVITKVYKNVDSAVRVMVIRTSDYPYNLQGERKIFAKAQETGENIGEFEENINEFGESEYETETFLAAATVCRYSVESFESGETDKFTVIIWLEGYDPQCVDAIKGGIIKMEMKFAAN